MCLVADLHPSLLYDHGNGIGLVFNRKTCAQDADLYRAGLHLEWTPGRVADIEICPALRHLYVPAT